MSPSARVHHGQVLGRPAILDALSIQHARPELWSHGPCVLAQDVGKQVGSEFSDGPGDGRDG
eukprot:10875778-Lingulodinium_polyedra.AAC.1